MDISTFIDKIANFQPNNRTFNQYSYENELGKQTRKNLSIYLEQMSEIGSDILLVGEAPGYHGCRWSGVPFTSENILIHGHNNILFGEDKGYSVSDQIKSEKTATIVWNVIDDLDICPLFWNAYPFHPHYVDDSMKNRHPSVEELEIGANFLQEIIVLFSIKKVIAVGKKAERTLNKLNIPCNEIRHPSFGGKLDFKKGISAFCV